MKSLLAFIVLTFAAGCAGGPGWSTTPLMTDDRFATVQQGMTRDDVQRLFGPPFRTMAYPLSGTDSWEYTGYDTWAYMVEYSVTFGRDGRVVSKMANRINVGSDKSP